MKQSDEQNLTVTSTIHRSKRGNDRKYNAKRAKFIGKIDSILITT